MQRVRELCIFCVLCIPILCIHITQKARFTKHTVLQNGVTEESWRSWLYNIVLCMFMLYRQYKLYIKV